MPKNDTDARIEALRQEMYTLIQTHIHDGAQASRINLDTSLFGLFETLTAAPTFTPRDTYDQIKIYSSGGVYRLYVYDAVGQAWHYASLT